MSSGTTSGGPASGRSFSGGSVPETERIAGEYDWGPGLTPPGLEGTSPSLGGRYRGKTPPTTDDRGLTALADELARRAR